LPTSSNGMGTYIKRSVMQKRDFHSSPLGLV
jgi:hypothetical protein